MALLSPMEIAEICQEQNAAYFRVIGRPDLADSWEDLDNDERIACEVLIKQIMSNPHIEAVNPKNNVQKITGALLVAMVRVLEKL